jgi:hypothetical protein
LSTLNIRFNYNILIYKRINTLSKALMPNGFYVRNKSKE